jgi:hypothetical protein
VKEKLLVFNSSCIFFGTTLYVGVLWALHFFWFPTWQDFKVENYYDQFIPQTAAATKFFTVVVPIMFLCSVIMVWKDWKTSMRWIAAGSLACLALATYVGTLHIIPINKILAARVTDQARLTDLFQQWMFLNDIRWVLMTLSWVLLMYYFGAKAYKLDTQP